MSGTIYHNPQKNKALEDRIQKKQFSINTQELVPSVFIFGGGG